MKAQQAATPSAGVYSRTQAERGSSFIGAGVQRATAPRWVAVGAAAHREFFHGGVGRSARLATGEQDLEDDASRRLREAYPAAGCRSVAHLLQKSNCPRDQRTFRRRKGARHHRSPRKPAGAWHRISACGQSGAGHEGNPFPQLEHDLQRPDQRSRRPGSAGPVGQGASQSFSWVDWGAGIYKGWEIVDYAAIAVADSAPLLLTPGRRCETADPCPSTARLDPFTQDGGGGTGRLQGFAIAQSGSGQRRQQPAVRFLPALPRSLSDKRGGSTADPSNKPPAVCPDGAITASLNSQMQLLSLRGQPRLSGS